MIKAFFPLEFQPGAACQLDLSQDEIELGCVLQIHQSGTLSLSLRRSGVCRWPIHEKWRKWWSIPATVPLLSSVTTRRKASRPLQSTLQMNSHAALDYRQLWWLCGTNDAGILHLSGEIGRWLTRYSNVSHHRNPLSTILTPKAVSYNRTAAALPSKIPPIVK